MRRANRILAAAMIGLAGFTTGVAPAEETQPQGETASAPETFTGLIMIMGGPGSGIVRFRLTVDRWSTAEERNALAETLRSGGANGLVASMEKMTMGRIQFDNNLANPIRLASTWQTGQGRKVRLATNRPIAFQEINQGTRSMDYPFGVIEFVIPPDGKGEGSLLGAVKVQFDKDGRLEVESLPTNTGAQKLTEIQLEVPKKKKEKKKS